MILRKIAHYDPHAASADALRDASFLAGPFCLTFPFSGMQEEGVHLEIPGALTLRTVRRSLTDGGEDAESLRREGCFFFREEGEQILEALCTMRTADGGFRDTYALRLPLSAPFAREGEGMLYFDGTWLRFLQEDGTLLNENAGLDAFAAPMGEVCVSPAMQGCFRAGRAGEATVTWTEEEEEGGADFYSPREWNCHAGDVMNFYRDGVYHLLYLRDRRHHGSRNGQGAHDIRQLTTTDLIHWREEEPVAEITTPWMSYGTGTMLWHDGKYYMVYGYHTERYQGAQEQVECTLDGETGTFLPLSCGDILRAGKLPAGASYSVSEDGVHFTPGGELYHPGRNPSTYAMPDGKVRVYAGYMGNGIWESDGFGLPFRDAGEDFTFVDRSVMKNTTECPSFFTWGGYSYLVIGFTGYYRTLTPGSSEYTDMAGRENIYDGLCVPMVTSFGEDRRLIAGWLYGVGWGSVIIHRELIREEGGRLGMKWVPEMVPETAGESRLSRDADSAAGCLPLADLDRGKSYRLEMTVDPGKASRMAISLEAGEEAAQLQLDFVRGRMQITHARPGEMAESIPTSYEIACEQGDAFNWWAHLPLANRSVDFCLDHLRGTDAPFTLRLLIRYAPKLRSTVVDAEVAGRQTLVSVRPDFFPDRVAVLAEGEALLSDMTLRELR